jgi:hypothetical protein
MVTSLVYQPFVPPLPAVTESIAVGTVASRLIVTDWLFVPPALVAVQVRVVPVVSVEIVVGPQPDCVEIAESGSETVHDTITSEVYQPFEPNVPDTLGVITGGVVSDGGGGAETVTE